MQLDPNQSVTLDATGRIFLSEWLFEQQGVHTQHAHFQDNCLDLELFNRPQAHPEFARIYLDSRIPTNAVYALVTTLQGRSIRKIHLHVYGEFTRAQKRAQAEFPLTLDLKEMADIQRILCESQAAYRKALNERYALSAVLNRPSKAQDVWAQIKRLLWGKNNSNH
jgi:hypothetical protein